MTRLVPLLFLLACGATARAPADLPHGEWRRVAGSPAGGVPSLVRSEEPAPGRRDDAGGIGGFCPPRAELFAIAHDRTLVLREPCSGPTLVVVRDARGEKPLASDFYGVGGQWRALPLGGRVLLVNEHMVTTLLIADPTAARVTRLPLPRELPEARRLEVSVSDGVVFVSGGVWVRSFDGGGCENPPPNQGCDPVVGKKDVRNRGTWVMRP